MYVDMVCISLMNVLHAVRASIHAFRLQHIFVILFEYNYVVI